MKKTLSILLFLWTSSCFANMASPIRPGTFSSSAFGSKDIDILSEKIHLKIDKDFNTAKFTVEYKIKTDYAGNQIPLLFHAEDYKGEFTVWVDNVLTPLRLIPQEFHRTLNTPFDKFSGQFTTPADTNQYATVTIYWENGSGMLYPMRDLKYFETDLSKGEHTISVEYFANVWIDVSKWVKEYKFRYSLSPAKNWRSFGNLQITVDASEMNSALVSSLGKPDSGSLSSVAKWNFNELPNNFFDIIYHPKINKKAEKLIELGPDGLTFILTGILALIHLLLVIRYRKRNLDKKHSWVVNIGSIIVSLSFIIFYIKSYDIIDESIGIDAGKHHGYTFLIAVIFPIILLVYWLFAKLIDRLVKSWTLKKSNKK